MSDLRIKYPPGAGEWGVFELAHYQMAALREARRLKRPISCNFPEGVAPESTWVAVDLVMGYNTLDHAERWEGPTRWCLNRGGFTANGGIPQD